MSRLTLALALAGMLAACSGPEPAKPADTPPPAPADPPKVGGVRARVRVTDPSGAPLAGMTPIATLQANAFDEPVSTGEPTGTDGAGTILLDSVNRLFVRAWDPELRLFAVNFFEVPPGEAAATEDMDVVMLPAGSLRAVVAGPDGMPVAGVGVEIMLLHAEMGPWWPCRATTGPDGAAVFAPAPPGEYEVAVSADDAGGATVSGVFIPPGGLADLGTVTLVPQ